MHWVLLDITKPAHKCCFIWRLISCFSNLALIAKIKNCNKMSHFAPRSCRGWKWWVFPLIHASLEGEQLLQYSSLIVLCSNTFCRNSFFLFAYFILPGMGKESQPSSPSNSTLLREDTAASCAPIGAALLAAMPCSNAGASEPWKCQSWLRATPQYLLWERECYTGYSWDFCISLGTGLDTIEKIG